MSYEHSDDRERYSESEDRESTEDHEREESPENKASESARDLEREEEVERAADKASRELEECESESRDAKEIADESSRELDSLERENEQSMEDELGHDLQGTRDDLHDRFVNDMERQLDGPSHKDSETDEQGEDGASSEATESSESYHDAGDGMAYALETKGGSGEAEAAETEAEQETQEVSEPGAQEPAERQVESEAAEEPVNDKGTNRITRQDSEEGETTALSESQETHDHKTSSTSPEVSETKEDTQEVSEGHSESEPSVSKEEQHETGELSETVEEEEEQTEGTITETSEPDSEPEDPEQVMEYAPESYEEPMSHEQSEAEEDSIQHETHEMAEDSEVETEPLENEPSVEDEPVPEDLEDFVKRVKDIMDETMDADDDYEYVQDPLTGEMQRVPKILSEYETEEQKQRRKRRNLFVELSEEERERFKELVREKAESEDERSAEAIERAWSQVVAKAEQEHEELLDKVRQVLESPDVMELLESMSEEDEGSLTTIEHADDDEIDEDESLDETLEQFLPMTDDEFQETLQKHSNLRKRKRIEQELEHTRIYYQCKEELEKTDFSHMSKREVWKYLSKKYGVPPTTLKNWFARGTLPRLLRAVRDEQAKAAGLNTQKPRTPTKLSIPETYDEFMSLLARHPYLRDAKGFDKMLRDVEEYYRLRDIARRSPDTSYSELSRQVNVPFDTARSWISGRTKPELLRRLLKNERMRRKMESDLQAAFPTMVDPSTVYDTLRPLRTKKNQTLKQIVDALEKLISNRDPITIVRLKPYNSQHGPRWLLDISKKIQRNREKIQRMLSERMKDAEVRVGLADNNLYLWKRNPSPWDYLELFSKERFYFKKRFQTQMIQQARERLGLKGNYHLSELIRQITDYVQEGQTKDRIISDLRPGSRYLHGNILQILLSSLKSDLREIQSDLEKIASGNQLVSPKILNEEEMKILLSRLFAIITSDGTLDYDRRIFYYEDNQTRRNRVKSILSAMGKVTTPDIRKRDGSIGGFHMPAILGRLLEKLGHPVGDKVLQGVRLPDFIMNGSPEVQLAYLQELIPEEGTVTINEKDNIRIMWSRSIVLFDSNKSAKFDFVQKLSSDLVRFIQNHGERKVRKCKWTGKEEVHFLLWLGDLERLSNHNDSDVVAKAKELEEIARANPSLHIEDEKQLCTDNGIMISEQSPGPIRYSVLSRRVSVKWQIRAASEDDVALWGLLAPPNDYRKRKKLSDWMNRHEDKVEKACKKLDNSQVEIKRLSNQPKEMG